MPWAGWLESEAPTDMWAKGGVKKRRTGRCGVYMPAVGAQEAAPKWSSSKVIIVVNGEGWYVEVGSGGWDSRGGLLGRMLGSDVRDAHLAEAKGLSTQEAEHSYQRGQINDIIPAVNGTGEASADSLPSVKSVQGVHSPSSNICLTFQT